MRQTYLLRIFILLFLFVIPGCKEKIYVLDEYSTMRYDVLALPAPAATTDLLAVAFASPSVGFVGGVGGTVYATADGGQTWASRSQPSLGEVRKLRLSSGPTVWAATSVGLFKTVNGGQSWQRAQFANSGGAVGPAFDVQFVTPLVGYAAGENGNICKTTDGGQTWTNLLTTAQSRFSLRAVSFTSPDSGQVVGAEYARYLTTDGGRSWSVVSGGAGVYRDVLRYGQGRFLLVGDKEGFSDNPATGISTSTVDENMGWPIYALARYPGPQGSVVAVGEKTVIRYDPAFSLRPATTPWTNVHAPNGASFTATFKGAAFADARTLYAVGPNGTLYRFYYQ